MLRVSRIQNPGFTLVELLIVVIILAIMATIVLPQFSGSAEESKEATLLANLHVIRDVVLRYRAEHYGRRPDMDQDGNPDDANALLRLTGRTQRTGLIDANGPVGPYINKWPRNPFNEMDDVRIGGAPAGAGTHGWHLDEATGILSADDSAEHAAL